MASKTAPAEQTNVPDQTPAIAADPPSATPEQAAPEAAKPHPVGAFAKGVIAVLRSGTYPLAGQVWEQLKADAEAVEAAFSGGLLEGEELVAAPFELAGSEFDRYVEEKIANAVRDLRLEFDGEKLRLSMVSDASQASISGLTDEVSQLKAQLAALAQPSSQA